MANPNLLVWASLDGNIKNHVTGVDGTFREGVLTYAPAVFHQGVHFRSGQADRIAFPVPSAAYPQGTLFVRFRCKRAWAHDIATNLTYNFLLLGPDGTSSTNYVRVILDYTSAVGMYGASYGTRGTAGTAAALLGSSVSTDWALILDDESTHSLAFVWHWNATDGEGRLLAYIDGEFVHGIPLSGADRLPATADTLWVGNSDQAGNRPAECVFEDVWFSTDRLREGAIRKMHDYPIDPRCLDDASIYDTLPTVANYAREVMDYYFMAHDPKTLRLWGVSKADAKVIGYSEDGGTTWTQIHTFAVGAGITALIIAGDHIIACNATDSKLYRSATAAANFAEVLAMSSGVKLNAGWNHTRRAPTGTIVIGEYKSPNPDIDPKVYKSVDDGATWSTVHTFDRVGDDMDHVHSVAYDPYTGRLWLTYGDSTEGIWYSDNDGTDWTVLMDRTKHVWSDYWNCLMPCFTGDAVLFGYDGGQFPIRAVRIEKIAPNAHSPAGHAWLVPSVSGTCRTPFPYDRGYCFANGVDRDGRVWGLVTYAGVDVAESGVFVSFDGGRTFVLAEGLGQTLYPHGYYIFDPGYGPWIYVGDQRIKQAVVDGTIYPDAGDVRAGTDYAGEALTGIFAVPAEADVRLGVGYGADGSEYTGAMMAKTGGARSVIAPIGMD